jgi:tripartite-type tricarboxylate transporter receptor subunit TctC
VVIADHVRAGKLRGIAVAGRERLSILPNVPTMAEAGYPIEGLGWNGIFVPAGTPAPVIARLQQEIARVLADKDIQEDAQRLGTQAGGEAPEAFAAFVQGEVRKWGQVIKDAGIKIE